MFKWIKRLVILVILLIVALFFGVSFAINSGIKKGVERYGPQFTGVDVNLDNARISPLSGTGELNEFVIGNPSGFKTPSSISIGKVRIELEPKTFLEEKLVIRSIRIEEPQITYERKLKESNLGRIMETIQAQIPDAGEAPPSDEEGKKLQVDEFIVSGAQVNLSASLLGETAVAVPLPEFEIRELGQGPEGITSGELAKLVMNEILDRTVTAVGNADLGDITEGITKSLGDALKGASEDGAGNVKEAVGGVMNLLKKDDSREN